MQLSEHKIVDLIYISNFMSKNPNYKQITCYVIIKRAKVSMKLEQRTIENGKMIV